MNRTVAALAAAGLAILAAGCGSAAKHPPASGSQQSQSPEAVARDAYRYAACIRAHGVPSFPEPKVSVSPGHQGIRQAVPAGVGTSPKFAAAQKACKGIMPEPENETAAQRSAREHERATHMLAFAQCLRAHGVQSFPDPGAQGQLTLAMIRAAGVDLQAPSFLSGAKACLGATHGLITLAQVEEAVHHPAEAEAGGSGGPGEGSSGGAGGAGGAGNGGGGAGGSGGR